jgi:hypothetical protein
MVKPFYYIIACIALHFLWGWIGGALLTLIVAGVVFERYVPLKTALTGGLIHVFLLTWIYIWYPQETAQMTSLVDKYLLDFLPFSVPVMTTLIPVVVYAIAGWVGEYGLWVYYKISIRDPREEQQRNWNQSF